MTAMMNTPASDDNGAVIEAQGVSKTFRDFWRRPRVRAVRDVSFRVEPGEVFGLLGPNGAGKSTTLKMILGLLRPTQGQLRVFGRPPDHVLTKARIGYLPEESLLYPYLSCAETLDFFGCLFDLSREERRERTGQLLQMAGLAHARDRAVGELSKGMARRIGLAQALVNDPDLIILDEPTSGLDPLGCRQVKDFILQLARRGKTILLSSHLLADVEDVCDRIGILYHGSMHAHGNIRELLEDQTRLSLALPDLPPGQLRELLEAVRQTLHREPVLERPQRTLEDYFIGVIQQARNEGEEVSGASQDGTLAPFLAANPPGYPDHATPEND